MYISVLSARWKAMVLPPSVTAYNGYVYIAHSILNTSSLGLERKYG